MSKFEHAKHVKHTRGEIAPRGQGVSRRGYTHAAATAKPYLSGVQRAAEIRLSDVQGTASSCLCGAQSAASPRLSRAWKFVLAFLTAVLVATCAWSIQQSFAAPVGTKNAAAKQTCDNVVDGTSPVGYTQVVAGVYRGGQAKSATDNANLDDHPNTFTNALPYGTVYIDIDKLSWDSGTSGGKTVTANVDIDIPDGSPFTTIKKGVGGYDGGTSQSGLDNFGAIVGTQLAYIGGTQAYIKGVGTPTVSGGIGTLTTDGQTALRTGGDKVDASGNVIQEAQHNDQSVKDYQSKGAVQIEYNTQGQNVITPTTASYLYQIRYKGAATLPDGSTGDVYLTVNKVTLETTTDVPEDAAIVLQSANQFKVYYSFTKDNEYMIPQVIKDGTGYRINAIGAAIDWDLKVVDGQGNAVNGTISYANKDLDLASSQNFWGKAVGDDYNEGIIIKSGTASYAVTPEYNSDDFANTNRNTGWTWNDDGPLVVSGGGSASSANGVTFKSDGVWVVRKADGSMIRAANDWSDGVGKNITAASSGDLGGKSGVTTSRWYEDQWQYQRPDNKTYDTGFAVLLDAKGSSMTWTGSSALGRPKGMAGTTADRSRQQMDTYIFDTTAYARLTQSHGTGGGVYTESYDIADSCNIYLNEGDVITGVGANAAVTAVPEEGYRVSSMWLEGVEYKVKDDGIYNTSGTKIAPWETNADSTVTASLVVTHSGAATTVVIEKNNDGVDGTGPTYDITYYNLQNGQPYKVHIDFETDYYFTKVWIGTSSRTKVPDTLNLTAVPFAYRQEKATINGTTYKITNQGSTYTASDGTAYTVNNSVLEIDGIAYRVVGNELAYNETVDDGQGGTTTQEKRIPITVTLVSAGSQEQFSVQVKDPATNLIQTEQSGTKTTYEPTTTATNVDVVKVVEDTESNTVTWYVKYPSAGDSTHGVTTSHPSGWQELPIETSPSSHDATHIERYYWFVTEEAPTGWSAQGYDNSKAETPGVVPGETVSGSYDANYYTTTHETAWAAASTKDYAAASAIITSADSKEQAFMSPLSEVVKKRNGGAFTGWGGAIKNEESLILKAEKTWDDYENVYNMRQDVWLHLDAVVGSETIKDYVAPQKLDKSQNTQTVTWGDKNETVNTGADSIISVNQASDIPDMETNGDPIVYTMDGKAYVGDNGKTYYVNQLTRYINDVEVKYVIRETDGPGKDSIEVNKTDPTAFLKGYTTTISDWDNNEFIATYTKVGSDILGNDIMRLTYTGQVKNKLETKDFAVKKVWADSSDKTHTAYELTKLFKVKQNDVSWPLAKYATVDDTAKTYTSTKYGENTLYTNDDNEIVYTKVTGYQKQSGSGGDADYFKELVEQLPGKGPNGEDLIYTISGSIYSYTYTPAGGSEVTGAYEKIDAFKAASDGSLTAAEPTSLIKGRNSVVVKKTADSSDKEWDFTLYGLPMYVVSGGNATEAIYSVEEEAAVDGYLNPVYSNVDDADTMANESATTDKGLNNGTITNRQKTFRKVTKAWDDDKYFESPATDTGVSNSYTRPNVIIKLTAKAQGSTTEISSLEKTQTITATQTKGGTSFTTFTGLPAYTDDGTVIEYTATETVPGGYTKKSETDWEDVVDDGVTGQEMTITNTPKEEEVYNTIDLTIKKEDSATAGTAGLNGAEFKVYTDSACTTLASAGAETSKQVAANSVTTEGSGTNTGKAIITFKQPGTYYVKETKAPEGYAIPTTDTFTVVVDKDLKTITLEGDGASAVWQWLYDLFFTNETKGTLSGNDTDGYTLTVKDDPIKANILVKKTWEDGDDLDSLRTGTMPSVKLQVSYDEGNTWGNYDAASAINVPEGIVGGEKKDGTYSVEAAAGCGYTWQNLAAYEDGVKLQYKVVETGKLTGYQDPVYSVESFTLAKIESGALVANNQEVTVTNRHATPQTKQIKRTITYTYLTEDGTEVTNSVEQFVTVKRTPKTVDPSTGAVTEWNDWAIDGANGLTEELSPTSTTLPSKLKGWTPDKTAVVAKTDEDILADIQGKDPGDITDYEDHVVYQPANPGTDTGITKNGLYKIDGSIQSQTWTPSLTPTDAVLPDGSGTANTIEKYTLLDANGNEVNTITTHEGTYTIDSSTGAVSFTPKDGFVGTATTVTIRAKDKLGTYTGMYPQATYTPTVVKNWEEATAEQEILYTYLTRSGEDIEGKTSDGTQVNGKVTRTATFKRIGTYNTATDSVDYSSASWKPTSGGTLPAAESPKVEGDEWEPNKTIVEEMVIDPNTDTNMVWDDASKTWKYRSVHVIYSPKDADIANYTSKNAKWESDGVTPLTQQSDELVDLSDKLKTNMLPDGSANEITDYNLTDPRTGEATKKLTTEQGTYELVMKNGKAEVKFTPAEDFLGTADPVNIVATDKLTALLASTIADLEATVVGADARMKTAQQDITAAQTALDAAQTSLDEKQTAVTTAQANFDTLKAELDAIADTTSPEYAAKQAEVDAAETALITAQAELQTANDTLDAAKQTLVAKQGDLAAAQEEKAEAEAELAKYETYQAPRATYTPTVVNNKQTVTPSRVITYTYITVDGKQASETVVQTLTAQRVATYNPASPDADSDGLVWTDNWTWPNGKTFPAVTSPNIDGWTTTTYAPELTLDDPMATVEPVHVVYTQPSTPKTYWVTYVDPDGSIYLEKTTVLEGEAEPAAPKDPSKKGYVFKGWDRSVDAEGNITYTAKWEPIVNPAPKVTPKTTAPGGTTAPSASPSVKTTPRTADGAPLMPLAASALLAACVCVTLMRYRFQEQKLRGNHARIQEID